MRLGYLGRCVVLSVVLLPVGMAACTEESDGTASSPVTAAAGSGECPTRAVDVVVTVDQWGDIVEQLGGACADVSTIIEGSSGDPHDYEPTPGDINRFGDAHIVVLNGVGYDSWATKAVDALRTRPEVVDAGEVTGRAEGDNPHLWYGPDFVHTVAGAIGTALKGVAPAAAGYFEERAATWATTIQSYDEAVAALRAEADDKTYAATESVFDYMATAVGLHDATPPGYRNAAANESEPAPGDIDTFRKALAAREIDVLIFNTQTEGAVPDQLRAAAKAAQVPVVEVTETVKPGAKGFVDWQVGQLQALAAALS